MGRTKRSLVALALGASACGPLPGDAVAPEPEPPPVVRAQGGDAPEISRSRGTEGGVLVFWPRVAPKSDDPATHDLAVALHQRLQQVATKAAPGRQVDVRPEPERVCPRAGCAAITVGALLTRRGDACAAMALVSGPGTSPARILPWAGLVKLRDPVVPFREPPESQVAVDDYVACSKLIESLDAREGEIVEYVKGLLP